MTRDSFLMVIPPPPNPADDKKSAIRGECDGTRCSLIMLHETHLAMCRRVPKRNVTLRRVCDEFLVLRQRWTSNDLYRELSILRELSGWTDQLA